MIEFELVVLYGIRVKEQRTLIALDEDAEKMVRLKSSLLRAVGDCDCTRSDTSDLEAITEDLVLPSSPPDSPSST
jgi:hypothetical protein